MLTDRTRPKASKGSWEPVLTDLRNGFGYGSNTIIAEKIGISGASLSGYVNGKHEMPYLVFMALKALRGELPGGNHKKEQLTTGELTTLITLAARDGNIKLVVKLAEGLGK